MICPKCTGQMAETTFGRNMFAHQCTLCQGLWFDLGEAERLKNKWMSEFLDTGNAEVGRVNNTVTDCPCPRCGDIMEHLKDTRPTRGGLRGLRATRDVLRCRRIFNAQTTGFGR